MSNLATLAVLERQHKGHPAGECVSARLAELKKQQTAAVAPPKPAPQLPSSQPKVRSLSPKRAAAPLTTAEERALKPKDSFKECAELPRDGGGAGGELHDGVAAGEEGRYDSEGPQRRVTIGRPFAVGKFEVTFAEWDACVADGGCSAPARRPGLGPGQAAGDQRVVG